ncbi:DUF6197 family protein [Streptomyces formicae]
MTTTEPIPRSAASQLADLCDNAASIIETNGLNRRFLYDEIQAQGGTLPADCRVDVFGALNIADHGTPLYDCSGRVQAAEVALQAHLGVPSLPIWNDRRDRTANDVAQALRATAVSLRAEAAA